MLHTNVQKFDVTINLIKFYKILKTKQPLKSRSIRLSELAVLIRIMVTGSGFSRAQVQITWSGRRDLLSWSSMIRNLIAAAPILSDLLQASSLHALFRAHLTKFLLLFALHQMGESSSLWSVCLSSKF